MTMYKSRWAIANDKGPTEVGMIHGFPGREASLMVVAQQFVQEVERFRADQVLVLAVHKPFPSLARVSVGTEVDQELTAGSREAEASKECGSTPSENVVKSWIQFNVVLVNVVIKILRAQNFCNSDKLQDKQGKWLVGLSRPLSPFLGTQYSRFDWGGWITK